MLNVYDISWDHKMRWKTFKVVYTFMYTEYSQNPVKNMRTMFLMFSGICITSSNEDF